ncbi:MAG: hypothetical protein AMJ53_00405 [Gammaproteobacteria bacterium SG8_11]|nr:MAG: hypothetical protein AMJ53_00405 [Gammaproteobacteria bacterium SG8_11]
MPKWFVYVVQSLSSDFIYIGSTDNLNRRLSQHNEGAVQSTKHYRPLEIITFIAVKTEAKARELENYFKTGSGNTILKKRFL